MVLLVVLLLVLVKIQLILADDAPFHLLGFRANVFKIGVSFRCVERWEVNNLHLRQPQGAATSKRDGQHEGCDGSPHDKDDGIHGPYCSWPVCSRKISTPRMRNLRTARSLPVDCERKGKIHV